MRLGGGINHPGRRIDRVVPRVALALVLLLVVGGTAAAFAVTESLKLEPSVVTRPAFIGPDGEPVARDRVFSPACECPQEFAVLEFTLRKADRVTASIVDTRGAFVRALVTNERLRRGPQRLTWDGLDDAGALAPDGPYRLRLDLRREGRAFLVPMVFRVDTKAPRLRLVRAGPTVITPDSDGEQDKIWVRFRSNEKGAPILAVDGETISTGGVRGAGQSALSWLGRVSREPAPPGEYEITLRVQDRAGNISEPVGPIVVEVLASSPEDGTP